jgi:hypothetical protein
MGIATLVRTVGYTRTILWLWVLCVPRIHPVAGWMGCTTGPFLFGRHPLFPDQRRRPSSRLPMGLMDSISDFLRNREEDFVKLDATESEFGPGPLLLAYGIPPGIANEELRDMIADGAPVATQKGCQSVRLSASDGHVLDRPLREALDGLASGVIPTSSSETQVAAAVPVLFFSGFGNEEMMAVYKIVGQEIHQESGTSPACAKAVPNAMGKPLRQVLDEISGDHQDAMSSQ